MDYNVLNFNEDITPEPLPVKPVFTKPSREVQWPMVEDQSAGVKVDEQPITTQIPEQPVSAPTLLDGQTDGEDEIPSFDFFNLTKDKVGKIPRKIRKEFFSMYEDADKQLKTIRDQINDKLGPKYKERADLLMSSISAPYSRKISDEEFANLPGVKEVNEQINKEYNDELNQEFEQLSSDIYSGLIKKQKDLFATIPSSRRATKVQARVTAALTDPGQNLGFSYFFDNDENYNNYSSIIQSFVKKGDISSPGYLDAVRKRDQYLEYWSNSAKPEYIERPIGQQVWLNGVMHDKGAPTPQYAVRVDNLKENQNVRVPDGGVYLYWKDENGDVHYDFVKPTANQFYTDQPLSEVARDRIAPGVDKRGYDITQGVPDQRIPYLTVGKQGKYFANQFEISRLETPATKGLALYGLGANAFSYSGMTQKIDPKTGAGVVNPETNLPEVIRTNEEMIIKGVYRSPQQIQTDLDEVNSQLKDNPKDEDLLRRKGALERVYQKSVKVQADRYKFAENMTQALGEKLYGDKDWKKIKDKVRFEDAFIEGFNLYGRQGIFSALMSGEKGGKNNLTNLGYEFINFLSTDENWESINTFSAENLQKSLYAFTQSRVKKVEDELNQTKIDGIPFTAFASTANSVYENVNQQINKFNATQTKLSSIISANYNGAKSGDQEALRIYNSAIKTYNNNISVFNKNVVNNPNNTYYLQKMESPEFADNMAKLDEIDFLKRENYEMLKKQQLVTEDKAAEAEGIKLGGGNIFVESQEAFTLGFINRGLSFLNSVAGVTAQGYSYILGSVGLGGGARGSDYFAASAQTIGNEIDRYTRVETLPENGPDGKFSFRNNILNLMSMSGSAGFDLLSTLAAPELRLMKGASAAAKYINRFPGLFGVFTAGNFYNEWENAERAGMKGSSKILTHIVAKNLIQTGLENLVNVKDVFPEGAVTSKALRSKFNGELNKVLSETAGNVSFADYGTAVYNTLKDLAPRVANFALKEFGLEENGQLFAEGLQNKATNIIGNYNFDEDVFNMRSAIDNVAVGLILGPLTLLGGSVRAVSNRRAETVYALVDEYGYEKVYNSLLDLRNAKLNKVQGSEKIDEKFVNSMLKELPISLSIKKPEGISDVKWLSIRASLVKKEALTKQMKSSPESMRPIFQSQIDQLDASISTTMSTSDEALTEAFRNDAVEILKDENGVPYFSKIKQIQDATEESTGPQQEGGTEGRVTEYAPAQQGEQVQAPQPTTAPSDSDISGQGQVVAQPSIEVPNIEVISQNALPQVNAISALPVDVEDGATFNADGTTYTGGGLVVPALSINTTTKEISPRMVADFMSKHKDKLSTGRFKVGIYKFPGSDMVSIDLNIIVDPSNEATALEFARRAGHESIYNIGVGNVKTGATGENVMSFNDQQLIDIANSLGNNQMPTVFGEPSVQQNVQPSVQPTVQPEAVTPTVAPTEVTPTEVVPARQLTEQESTRMSDARTMTPAEFSAKYPDVSPESIDMIKKSGFDNEQDFDNWQAEQVSKANQVASQIRDSLFTGKADMNILSHALYSSWSKIVPGLSMVWDNYASNVEKAGYPEAYKDYAGFYDPATKTVYINPDKMGLDTPIHEFGHVWYAVANIVDKNLTKRGRDLIRGTEYEARVRAMDAYKDLEPEEIEEEALVLAIGERGAGIIDQVRRNNFLTWLSDLFNLVAKKFGVEINVENLTLGEFLDFAAMDILSGGQVLLNTSTEVEVEASGVKPSIVSAERYAAYVPQVKPRLDKAKQMQAQGQDSSVIWEETGMENVDGKWMSELNYDAKITIDMPASIESMDAKGESSIVLPIAKVFSYPEFFKVYPDARKINVKISRFNSDYIAAYDDRNNIIRLNIDPEKYEYVGGDYTSAVLHELQHYAQEMDKTPGGANLFFEFDSAKSRMANTFEKAGFTDDANTVKSIQYGKEYTGNNLEFYKKVLSAAEFSYLTSKGEIQARNVEKRFVNPQKRQYAPTVTQDKVRKTEEQLAEDAQNRLKLAGSETAEPTKLVKASARTGTPFGDEINFKPGGYNLSFVQESDLIDIVSLIKDIQDKGQTVWFWTADQLGRGIIADETIDGEHYLDAGPSFALDPENRKLKIIWATSADEQKLNKYISESDYIFIISGSPQKSKLFNRAVVSYLGKRIDKAVGGWDKFREDVIRLTTTTTSKGDVKTTNITKILEAYPTLESLINDKGTARKDLFVELEKQRTTTNTPLKKYLDDNKLSFDVDLLRDKFFSENGFDINDVMLVLKPTGLGGESSHSTYQRNILGEVVGVPNRRVNGIDILPEERRAKYTEAQRKTPLAGAAGSLKSTVKLQAASVKSVLDSGPYSSLLTQDENSYYFFHWSNEERKVIDPKKFGNNRITSREERIARPSAAFFYTRPDFREMGVGDYGHVVKVTKDKVYPATADPLNFFDEAKSLFEKSHPGMAFGPNQQIGWITKVANAKGYDMVVAKWGKQLRAETTNKVKPEWYSRPSGWATESNPKYAKLKKGVNKLQVKPSISSRYGLDDKWSDRAINEARTMLNNGMFQITENTATGPVGFTLSVNGNVHGVYASMQEAEDQRDNIIKATIMKGYPQVSEMVAQNILFNAKRKDFTKPLNPSTVQGILPSVSSRGYVGDTRTVPQKIKDATKRFFRKYFTFSKGLPKEITLLKESLGGKLSYQVSLAESMVKDLNKAAKKIGFEDWATYDQALRDYRTYNPTNPFWIGGQPEYSPAANTNPAFFNLPAEIRRYVVNMRALLDGMSEQLVRNGLVSPDMALTLESNMGKYVHRSYALFTMGDEWSKKVKNNKKVIDTAHENLFQLYYAHLTATNPNMSQQEIINQANEEADKEINRILDSKKPFFGRDEASFLPYRNTGSLRQRQEQPQWLRDLLGEYTDPGTAFLLSVGETATLLQTSDYLAKLRDFGLGSVFFEEGNRPADATYRIGSMGQMLKPLEGLYTTKEMYDLLIETDNNRSSNLKWAWRLMNLNKMMKTVFSPVTQFKNFLSNTGFAMHNGYFDVTAISDAWGYFRRQVVNNKSQDVIASLRPLFERGVLNQSLTAKELANIFRTNDFEQYVLDNADKPGIQDYLSDPGKLWRATNRAASRLYQASDDFWKIYAYYNEQRSLSKILYNKEYESLTQSEKDDVDNQSADRVMNVMPTYDRVLEIFKTVSKTGVLGNFTAFRAEVFRVLANSYSYAYNDIVNGIKDKNPRMVSYGTKRLLGIASYNALRMEGIYLLSKWAGLGVSGLASSLWGGGDDEDKEKLAINSFVADWAKSDDKIYNNSKVKDGVIEYYTFSSVDPYATIYNIFNAYKYGNEYDENGGLIASSLEVVAPFIEPEMTLRAFSSAITNKDAYGFSIYNEDDTYLRKIFDGSFYVAKETLTPGAATWLNRMFYRRDDDGKKQFGFNPSELYTAPVGARPYVININRKWSSELFNASKNVFGDIPMDFNRAAKNNESYEDRANERYNKEILRLHKIYTDAIRLGYPEDKLLETLKSSRIDRRTKMAILTGETFKVFDKEGKIGRRNPED